VWEEEALMLVLNSGCTILRALGNGYNIYWL
jgi:hypothetical protein